MPDLSVLFSADEVAERVRRLAGEIDALYGGEEVVVIGVLKGAFVFVADLTRQMRTPCVVDFVQISTYDGSQSTGVFKLQKDHDVDVHGRHVLVVEDIVDTGLTLARLLELLATREPASLRAAALLDKPSARKVVTPIDFVGFEIPGRFVVGYGLDYGERFRNLPYIAEFRP